MLTRAFIFKQGKVQALEKSWGIHFCRKCTWSSCWQDSCQGCLCLPSPSACAHPSQPKTSNSMSPSLLLVGALSRLFIALKTIDPLKYKNSCWYTHKKNQSVDPVWFIADSDSGIDLVLSLWVLLPPLGLSSATWKMQYNSKFLFILIFTVMLVCWCTQHFTFRMSGNRDFCSPAFLNQMNFTETLFLLWYEFLKLLLQHDVFSELIYFVLPQM